MPQQSAAPAAPAVRAGQQPAAQPDAPAAQLSPSPEQKMREAIAAIPAELADVRWYPPEGATREGGRLLVHVRQMHAPSVDDIAALPADVRETIEKYLPKAREDLDKVLTRVTAPGTVFALHLEGMNPERAAQYTETLKQLRDGRETAATLEEAFKTKTSADSQRLLDAFKRRAGDKPSADQQKVLNALSYLVDYQRLSERVAADPALKAVYGRELKLVGAEDTKLHDEMMAYARANPTATVDDPRMAEMMDKRDTHLVTKVGEGGARTNLVVLGAGHDLRAEVDSWNKAHPESPLTLVEIEPRGVATFLRDAK